MNIDSVSIHTPPHCRSHHYFPLAVPVGTPCPTLHYPQREECVTAWTVICSGACLLLQPLCRYEPLLLRQIFFCTIDYSVSCSFFFKAVMSLYLTSIAVRLGRLEFHLWSICEVFLLLRKWCIPECSVCCSFKFSEWRGWVSGLHRSGAEKAMKALSDSGVWGCSEPLGHCWDQHHTVHPWDQTGWDAAPRMTLQGGASLFIQVCPDKRQDQRGL